MQELKQDTEHQLSQIESSEKDDVKRLHACAVVLHGANARLKDFIVGYEFADETEEIDFFKNEKPRISSSFIYYCEAYNIEIERPIGGPDVQRDYLHRVLVKLQDYIECHQDFYSYYRLGLSDNDTYYFTRDKLNIGRHHLEPIVSEREQRYSTNGDYKLARLQANEELEILIKSKLDELEIPRNDAPRLSWNTKKRFLIELLYALDSFRAFGRVPLSFVAKIVGGVFGVNLDNMASEFAEMRTRDNPTPFLDLLKEALLQRMNKLNKKK